MVLHLAGRRDAERRARDGAGRRVDDRDGVAGALCHGLVQLHVVLVAGGGRVERIRSGGEEEGRSRLDLLLERRALGRARRQRSAVGSGGGVDGLQVVLGQEVEGAEELVVVKLEALGGLHALQVLGVRGRLRDDLLDAALSLELAVRILRRNSRAPPAATVVAVGVVRRMGGDGRVVRHPVMILVRHCCDGSRWL